MSDVVELPVRALVPVRIQRRTKAPCYDLVASFQTVGQLHPVVVVDRGDGTYGLVAGYRRLLAARRLRWATIQALVFDDANRADMAAIHENIARAKLQDDVLRAELRRWEAWRSESGDLFVSVEDKKPAPEVPKQTSLFSGLDTDERAALASLLQDDLEFGALDDRPEGKDFWERLVGKLRGDA